METLEFGTIEPTKTPNDYIAEIQDVLGCTPPISVTVIDGLLKQVAVEPEWREGGTTAVEQEVEVETEDENGEPIVVTETQTTYVEDYTEKKLTQPQITALQTYIQNNLVQ